MLGFSPMVALLQALYAHILPSISTSVLLPLRLPPRADAKWDHRMPLVGRNLIWSQAPAVGSLPLTRSDRPHPIQPSLERDGA